MADNPTHADRVEIPPDAFIRKTGQLWKLVVAGAVLPWPAVAIGLWTLRRIGPDQTTGEFLVASGAVATLGALLILLLASVKCPKCAARLVSRIIWDPDGLAAFTRLLGARSCPACGHTPAAPAAASAH